MNIIQIQERLKDVSDNDLVQEMQSPSGSAPQYLVLSELQRRKRMRDEFQRQQASEMPTVAEEAVAAAGVPQGGIMQVAGAMAPKSSIAQDTGVNDMTPTAATRAPQEPMRMAEGGVVKMQRGGPMVRATAGMDMYDYMSDPAIRALANQNNMSIEEYVNSLSPEMRRILLDTVNRPSPSPLPQPQGMGAAPTAASRPGNAPDLGINRVMPPVDFDATAPDMPTEGIGPFTPDIPFNRMARSAAAPEARPDIAPTRNLPMVPGSIGGMGDMAMGDMTAPVVPGASVRPETGGIAGLSAPTAQAEAAMGPTLEQLDEVRRARSLDYKPYTGREFMGAEAVGMGRTPEPSGAGAVRDEGPVSTGGAGRAAGRDTPPASLSQLADMFGIGAGKVGRQAQARGKFPETLDEQRQARTRAYEPYVSPEEEVAPPGLALPGVGPMDDGVLRMPEDQDLTFGDLVAGTIAETSDTGTTTGGGVTGGGAGGAGVGRGSSDLERLMAAREKRAEQDKWLSLAQFGMQLMASTQPTLGGAIGEAGMTALSGLRESQEGYEEDMLDYLALQQRERAFARGAGGASAGAALPPLAKMGDVKSGIDIINSIINEEFTGTDELGNQVPINRDSPRYLALEAQRQSLLDQYFGRLAPTINAADLPPVSGGGIANLPMGTPLQ